ncbi:MAG: DUF4955 domain-containing protein [Candidatus Phocaeicola merdigallinarum]|nr:DUF4955 domain-containing protein [Candidatus Phocaeicola merdigallinarum]
MSSCKKDNLSADESTGADSPTADGGLAQLNRDIADMQQIAEGKVKVLTYTRESSGRYLVELDNEHILTVYAESEQVKKNSIPLVGIDADGYWVYELDGHTQTLTDADGQPAAALSSTGKGILTPRFQVGEKRFWEVSYNGTSWMQIGNRQVWDTEKASSAAYSPFAGCTVDEDARTLSLSLRCGEQVITSQITGKTTTEAWNKFVAGSADNVLLDFSYAGYKHGEEEAPDGFSLGYQVVNVRDRMVQKNMTARNALLDIMAEYKLDKGVKEAKVVIYFPEGRYVLHNEEDNTYDPDKTDFDSDGKGNNTSNEILMFGGNFIIKGDGADKTFLEMETPNLPKQKSDMYSSPVMINIKNNAWLGTKYEVIGNAGKGTFTVKVSGSSNFKVGEWVCLYLHDNNPELVKQELLPYAWESNMTNISTEGVQVEDYHQIVSISGDEITFKEPIMHEVDTQWDWKLCKYSYYENVGVEDLTFVGHAVDDFKHHRSWIDDGAYKPIAFMRVVNSWMRRVNFESVSEAASIISSANFSAYNIDIKGNRGHSAIRSQGSSRVFIGAVRDYTDGPLADAYPTMQKNAGQYHACGVSKPSMGAVIWRVTWGQDACFESHATQPRATLIDNCTGGFVQSRQGGDANQVPNHLNDLTIWNMCSTNTKVNGNGTLPANGEFDWWRTGWQYWKILPPIIVGFHGEPVKFVQEQVKLDESNGIPVEPQSLYEAQLAHRLGSVPAWLNALK